MNNIINLDLLANPTNWLVLFVIFTFWAVASCVVQKSAANS